VLSPKEENKFLKNINDINDISYLTLFDKYLIQNKKGYSKLTEIESTDQESIVTTHNGGYPIPGMIYTFIYGEPDQIQIRFGAKEFIDVAPILFCINNKLGGYSGINLNMLPNKTRLDFLESFYQTFKGFFKDVEALTQNEKVALNKRFIEYVKSGKGQDIIRLFNRKNGANFNYGYRSYKVEKVRKLRMIEYNEWNYIPFYNPINAFRKLDQRQIHKLYYNSL